MDSNQNSLNIPGAAASPPSGSSSHQAPSPDYSRVPSSFSGSGPHNPSSFAFSQHGPAGLGQDPFALGANMPHPRGQISMGPGFGHNFGPGPGPGVSGASMGTHFSNSAGPLDFIPSGVGGNLNHEQYDHGSSSFESSSSSFSVPHMRRQSSQNFQTMPKHASGPINNPNNQDTTRVLSSHTSHRSLASHDDTSLQHSMELQDLASAQPSRATSDSSSSTGSKPTKKSDHSPLDGSQVGVTSRTSPSPSSSPASEFEKSKVVRVDSLQENEGQLLELAMQVAESDLADSASKLRKMDADGVQLRNDPIFGPIANARDIKHDRHLQAFALAWLNQACESSPAAVVPRNRIYARYVQMCGDHTVTPLMPAAFGRLVRIMFPNLATRRLGMRGKSKYHYCGIKLKGDHIQVESPVSSHSSAIVESPQSANAPSPPQHESPDISQILVPPSISFVNVQEHFLINDFKYLPDLYDRIERSVSQDENNQLILPSIYAYLPKEFEYDPDIADTLSALVKIQCTSMFESIRYMKTDDLFRALVPSHAILNGPSFKLLNSEHAMDWVKNCDLAMYRAMLKMLSRLNLKTVNKDIVASLREISLGFVSRLASALGERFSQTFKVMKLKLARQFIKLVSRLLRCIETGFRAGIVLSNPNDRSVMLSDWSKLNFQDSVLREIPCGVETSQAIINILEVQVIKLLQETPQEGSILKKYASFLFQLPRLFPNVNPWLYSLLLSNLLTSFIREMSMVGSRSFKLWWIVGCWINEYMSWSFELGGYLHDELASSDDTAQNCIEGDSLHNINSNLEFESHQKQITSADHSHKNRS